MKKQILATALLIGVLTAPSAHAITIYSSEDQKSNMKEVIVEETEKIDASTIDGTAITSMKYASYYQAADTPDRSIQPDVHVTKDRLDKLKKRMKVQSRSQANFSSGNGMTMIYPTQYEGVDKKSYTSLTDAINGTVLGE